MAEKGKMHPKKWCFSGKNTVFGALKKASRQQNRKAKWCKMQVLFLEMDKTKGPKDPQK